MGYEKEDGTRIGLDDFIDNGEWDVYAVYEFIVKHDDGIVYEAYETPEDAVERAREWLVEEMGGTDAEVEAVKAMTDEQVHEYILDYEYVSFCDVAHRRVLFF
jgi:hypothetical protein